MARKKKKVDKKAGEMTAKERRNSKVLKVTLIFVIGFLVLSALMIDMTITGFALKDVKLVVSKDRGLSDGKIAFEVGSSDPAEQVDSFYRWFYQQREEVEKENEEYWSKSLRPRVEISADLIEDVRGKVKYQKGEVTFGCQEGKPTKRQYDKPEIFQDKAIVTGYHTINQEEILIKLEMIKHGNVWQIDKISCDNNR